MDNELRVGDVVKLKGASGFLVGGGTGPVSG